MHNVAKVILYDKDGLLVMQQRDRGSLAKDKLSFFGGGIETDEATTLPPCVSSRKKRTSRRR